MRSKRGTEKPIEIFVALFVILAVALVMLKLFQSQITEKQKQLSDFEQEQRAKELRQKVQLHCQTKCTEASNNGCSYQSLAALCLSGSHQVLDEGDFIDLNGDNQVSYDIDNFGGEGVCEDQVYCFSLIDSCCARKINADTCSDILETYWGPSQKGFDEAQTTAICSSTVKKGTCASGLSEMMESLAWWNGFDACFGTS